MTDIETIREAAALMRQRAVAATDGPWIAAGDGLVWAERPGDPVSGSTEPEDAEHIAAWHPAVALAIADWLDDAAAREEQHWQRSAHYAYADPCEGDEVYGALIVARAFLGGAL